jgi:hypothetical protein
LNPKANSAKTPADKTGIFATLSNLCSANGSGARSLRLIAPFALCVIALLTLAALASAREVHVFKESFGEAGAGNGQLSMTAQSGVAINGESGDVYVADTANARVEQFEADGTFVGTFGTFTSPTFVAIDNSSGLSEGDVYVVDSAANTVSKFSDAGAPVAGWGTAGVLSGSGLEPFAEIAGIAVDSAGNLSVLEVEPHRILKFAQDGSFSGELPTPRGSTPAGLAVAPNGDYFKVNGSLSVEQLTASGAEIGQVTAGPEASAIAVDPANGDLYLTTLSEVLRYHLNAGGEVVEASGSTCAPVQAAEPPFGGCGPSEAFGSEEPAGGSLASPAGLAITTTHTAYLANVGASNIAVFDAVHTPTVLTGEASGLETEGAATLNGTVDPEGVAVSECRFEYGPTAAYGSSAECTPFPGAGSGPEATSAALNGLEVGRYHFRLVAVNANGEDIGADHTFAITSSPLLSSEALVGATATTATLGARLEANGLATSYQLEYGATTAYGLTSALTDAGAPFGRVGIQATLTGLAPSTVYHARFAATNARGTVQGAKDIVFTTAASGGDAVVSNCPNRTFSGFSPLLPDCRAYEFVSGAGGAGEIYTPVAPLLVPQREEDITTEVQMRAAATGHSVAYVGEAGESGGSGAGGRGLGDQFLAMFDPSQPSWDVSNITPAIAEPEVIPQSPLYEGFSGELSVGILASRSPTLSAAATPPGPSSCYVLYSRSSEGTFHALFTETQAPGECGKSSPPEPYTPQNLLFAGANEGTPLVGANSHLLFQSPAPLVQGAQASTEEGQGNNLYESIGGEARLVSVLPGGEPDANAVFGARTAPADKRGGRPNFANVISADGSRIFWTDLGSGRIYARLSGTETVPVSAGSATYQGASVDGHFVFYIEAGELWRFDTHAPPGEAREALAGAGVQGTPGISEDGSYVYFVSGAALTADAETRNCRGALDELEEKFHNGELLLHPGEGERLISEKEEEERGHLHSGRGCNLYLRHDGETKLVATLSALDNNLRQRRSGQVLDLGVWQGELGSRTARVADGGRTLVFQSTQQLTGYNNSSLAEAGGPEFAVEVFVYNAVTERIVCASCDPSGDPPAPEAVDNQGAHIGAGTYLPVSSAPTFMPRWISADGSRVFFVSSQPLAEQDINRTQDVYEWERAGTAGCSRAEGEAGGCISLLSGGNSNDLSFFIDASADGGDVFLIHRGQLGSVGPPDGHTGVFDVRVGGGSSAVPAGCVGSACQGPSSGSSAPAPSSSEAFDGHGNVAKVRKHKTKKHHAKKHHKTKRHAVERTAGNNRGAVK